MAVTSLLNTSWHLNDTPDVSTPFNYKITWLWEQNIGVLTYYTIICEQYRTYGLGLLTTTSATSSYRTNLYVPNNKGVYSWNTTYRDLFIFGGDDVENADLIAWLQANATQTEHVYKVRDDALWRTAEGIRRKNGQTSAITWDSAKGFFDTINAIYLGNDTRQCTAVPSQVLADQTAYSKARLVTGVVEPAEGVSF